MGGRRPPPRPAIGDAALPRNRQEADGGDMPG